MVKNDIFRNIFKPRLFMISLKLAIKGVLYLFLYHRNMRIIFMMGVTAFLLGVYFKLRGIELVALCITITIVFVAEIFNTAIELMMDMLTDKYHTKIRIIKDIAAAIVLLSSLNAVAIGCILFLKKLPVLNF